MDDITINIIKTLIKEALGRWEPRIAVTRVTVQEVPEYNNVIATIEYRYKDTGLDINESISVSLIE
jgi:phage baseplate assembly protein W